MPRAKTTKTSTKKTANKSTGDNPKARKRKTPPRISELPEPVEDEDEDVDAYEPGWKARCQDIADDLHEVQTLVMGAMTTKIRHLELLLGEALNKLDALQLSAMQKDIADVAARLDDCEGLILEAFPAEDNSDVPT